MKGAPKKVKSNESRNSMSLTLSYFEHVDSHFPDSPTPKSKKNIKDARITKPSHPSLLPKIIHTEKMSLFMQKYFLCINLYKS